MDANSPEIRTLLSNPQVVPAKFKDAEGVVQVDALVQAYTELEKKLGAAPAPAPAPAPAAPAAPAQAPAQAASTWSDMFAAPAAPKADIIPAAQQEFASTGKLSDATLSALVAAHGEAGAKAIVSGWQATQREAVAQAAQAVGGMEKLKEMISWAKTNLSPERQQAIMVGLSGPAAEDTLLGLKARFDQAKNPQGTTTTVVAQGSGQTPPGGFAGYGPGVPPRPFVSAAEQAAAMADPRYRYDPVYQGWVATCIGIKAGIPESAYREAGILR